MAETFTALWLAHLLADFPLQPRWLVEHKRNFLVLLLHVLIATLAAAVILGRWRGEILLVVLASHLAIDLLKTYALPDRLWTFLADQASHLAALAVAAWWLPDSARAGLWFSLLPNPADQRLLLEGWTLAAGLILCVPAGGVLIAKTVKPMLPPHELAGLQGVPNGGRIIGYLERALVFLLLWIDQAAGIGFLVTAKSILRFGDIKDSANRRMTEYVIIGTFLSFGWAILTSQLTLTACANWSNGPVAALLAALP